MNAPVMCGLFILSISFIVSCCVVRRAESHCNVNRHLPSYSLYRPWDNDKYQNRRWLTKMAQHIQNVRESALENG